MTYADLPTLLARAGRLAPAWTNESDPDQADLLQMLEDTAAEIDTELLAAGVPLPVNATTAKALAGVNADAALTIAIPATFPLLGEAENAILREARARWDSFLTSVRDGSYPAVKIVVDVDEEAAVVAHSFWDTDVGYPYDSVAEWNLRRDLRPGVFRGEGS